MTDDKGNTKGNEDTQGTQDDGATTTEPAGNNGADDINQVASNYRKIVDSQAAQISERDSILAKQKKEIAKLNRENAAFRVKNKGNTEDANDDTTNESWKEKMQEVAQKTEERVREEFKTQTEKLSAAEKYAYNIGIKGALENEILKQGLLDREIAATFILNNPKYDIRLSNYSTGEIIIADKNNPQAPATDYLGKPYTIKGLVEEFAKDHPRFVPDRSATGAGSSSTNKFTNNNQTFTPKQVEDMTMDQYGKNRKNILGVKR